MTFAEYRACFPHAEEMVYMDHAATGPLSTPVMEAMTAFLEQRHRTNPNNYVDLHPTIKRGRVRVAELLGCSVDRVEYAPNTSYGLNVLALGYPWKPGDRVAVPACEFPANVLPWLGLRDRFEIDVDFIPSTQGVFSLSDVERSLTPETRILAVSWVQFLSGFRCDLKALAELAHSNGTLLAVDAIQGLGALRLDVEDSGIDFLSSGAQKWLLAAQGSAIVYVTEELQERLNPVRGWLNGPVDWEDFGAFTDELHEDATRFRLGTLNSIGCVALDAALGLHLEMGADRVEKRVLENARVLAKGLDELGLRRFGSGDRRHQSGIITVEAPNSQALFDHLGSQRICVSLRDRKIRFAPHAYNSKEEIGRVLEACRDHTLHAVA